ncbi:MAG: PorV/PorQ family protein [Melioribacteraceae bacterium]|nr:PorV/PorQ family protein [Melioribacteraceae bacterium]
MGGASAAITDDVTAGYWNPAGLARINYPQIALMHEEHFGNLVNYNYGAVAIPYGEDMSFGISVIRLSIDGIPDTRNAGYNAVTGEKLGPDAFNNPNLRIDYNKITEFTNADYAVYFTFAKRHSENFYWGANVKLIKRDIAEYSATGIGFDIGAYYKATERLHLGANLQDATTTLVAWNTDAGTNELISPTLKLGAAYGIDFFGGKITPAMDFDIRFEGREFASNFNVGPVSFDVHSGLEFNYKNIFAIRGGYSDVKQLTVGAGINLPKLTIDYSFAKFNEEDDFDSHRISLILTLEEPRFLRKGL